MTSTLPRDEIAERYEAMAAEYMRSLPLEHFMESTIHAEQRVIAHDSLQAVASSRTDVHVFMDLLIQYPIPRKKAIGRVVPDNMVVLSTEPIGAKLSYTTLIHPVPFWVLEYVSATDPTKDYVASFRKYERELKIPYYLIFDPSDLSLDLYRLDDGRYASVRPNRHGRLPIRSLSLEMAVLDGFVRFWFEGKLLDRYVESTQRAEAAEQRAEESARRAESERQARLAAEAELARLREQMRRGSSFNGHGPN